MKKLILSFLYGNTSYLHVEANDDTTHVFLIYTILKSVMIYYDDVQHEHKTLDDNVVKLT